MAGCWPSAWQLFSNFYNLEWETGDMSGIAADMHILQGKAW